MTGEAEVLAKTAGELRAKARRLRRVAEAIDRQAEELEATLSGGSVEVVRGGEVLGRLAALVVVGEAFHYTEALDRLRAAGISPSGVDPAATLLAAMGRSTLFESVSPRSGIFRRVAP